MAQSGFNPLDRRETWLFSEVSGRTHTNNKVYRRLKFNVVQFGDDPEEFLEPVNVSDLEDMVTFSGPLSARDNGTNSGMGRMSAVRMMKGRYSPYHSFDDFDAAAVDTSVTA